jgi:ceramide glucosyltransferase
VTYLFLGLALAALAYQILAYLGLARLFLTPAQPPGMPSGPGVTIFKPLKGLDPVTRECLSSFLTQDYHPYQVLFGVGSPDDPVLPVLEELKQTLPGPEVEVIICPQAQGLNPKISLLRQMEPRARYDLLVISDADVKVSPDFLATIAAACHEPGVGLVSCPYRAGRTRTLGAHLEALTISADFIPAVAVSLMVEPLRFALGAVMALPRRVLSQIGGFSALADFLADDYQLGWRTAQAGFGVRLIPHVVETQNPEMSLKDYLAHQSRWSRTYRVCRPKGYLGYGITHALVYGVFLSLASHLAPAALGLLAAILALRLGLAYFSERVCLQGDLTLKAFWLLPLKDFLSFGLWLLSFLGRRVTWKDASFRVTPDGKLVPE